MRVITFSRYFPKGHPKAGEPTFFVEKIWKGLKTGNHRDGEYSIWTKHPRLMKAGYWQLPHLWRDQMCDKTFKPKYHTIRAGNRWKVGDMFSPRVWSGKPYRSKQIEFAPPIEIKKIWNIRIEIDEPFHVFIFELTEKKNEFLMLPTSDVAKNDGLTYDDFKQWFKPHCKKREDFFLGQIICWNEKIDY